MAGETVSKVPKQLTPFKPGQSGNPNGRPKGSRNKLGEAFIAALHDDFKEHGVKAIKQVREDRPHEYLKVVASILPKELKIERVGDDLSDQELDQRIRQLAGLLSLEMGISPASGAEADQAVSEQARSVYPLQ